MCELVEKGDVTLFEGPDYVVLQHPEPAVPGHLIILPKEHAEIVEKIPETTIKHMMLAATKLSIVLFEAVQAQGTNVLWFNGPSAGQRRNHAALHVLPRKENDGLSLLWQPSQVSEDEISTAALKLEEAAKGVGIPEQAEKPEPKRIEEPKEEVSERVKHLERIP